MLHQLRQHLQDVKAGLCALGLARGAQREVHEQRGAVLDRVLREGGRLAQHAWEIEVRSGKIGGDRGEIVRFREVM